MALIIVESPTKARTFNRILKGKDYFVFATFGHIRDLPKNKIAIDYKKQFKPGYQIIANKYKVVTELKRLAEKNTEIILATDLDREGEAISYHIAYLLGLVEENWPESVLKVPKKMSLKRIVFHEITTNALMEALKNPQELRMNLVKAQQARRILDRIVGYELSPLLWKTMGKKWLSAGRVQTVALRLVVEREKEIKAFKLEKYFQIYGLFNKESVEFKAKLIKKDDVAYEETIKLSLFDGNYQYTKNKIDNGLSEAISNDLNQDKYKISAVKEDITPRYPPPPLITSSLQQDAFNKLGFSSRMTMKLAQNLYEQGLITYHRTDSFNLSTQFVFKARDYILEKYGKEYVPEKPRGFKTKSKNAQEAHEAIRPTKLNYEFVTKKETKLTHNHKRLYQLIFNRAVSTQMKEASVKTVKIDVLSNKNYLFQSEWHQVMFDGFLKLLNPDFVKNHQTAISLNADDPIVLKNINSEELETRPPPRYTEASLIKSLEEKEIGRPSTYAPIVSLIQDKNYIEKEMRYFKPTKLGEAISDYLSQSFSQLFDLNFTAEMENSLDKIANNEKDMIQLLTEFYTPFEKILEEKKAENKTIDVEEEIDEKCPRCQGKLVVRYSKFGKFLGCANYPTCKFTKPFLKFVVGQICPKDGGRLTVRFTKSRKRFYGCENWPKCDYSAWKLNFQKKE